MRTAPLSPYAVSKLATEAYALAHACCYDLDVLAFRFFNVFGPLQAAGHAYAAVVPAFVDAALAGRPLPVHGDGEQTRDFTYVGTVCDVITDAVGRRVAHRHAGQPGVRHPDLAARADRRARGRPRHAGRPWSTPTPRAGDVRDSQADTTLLTSLFPDASPPRCGPGSRRPSRWFQEAAVSTQQ